MYISTFYNNPVFKYSFDIKKHSKLFVQITNMRRKIKIFVKCSTIPQKEVGSLLDMKSTCKWTIQSYECTIVNGSISVSYKENFYWFLQWKLYHWFLQWELYHWFLQWELYHWFLQWKICYWFLWWKYITSSYKETDTHLVLFNI